MTSSAPVSSANVGLRSPGISRSSSPCTVRSGQRTLRNSSSTVSRRSSARQVNGQRERLQVWSPDPRRSRPRRPSSNASPGSNDRRRTRGSRGSPPASGGGWISPSLRTPRARPSSKSKPVRSGTGGGDRKRGGHEDGAHYERRPESAASSRAAPRRRSERRRRIARSPPRPASHGLGVGRVAPGAVASTSCRARLERPFPRGRT